MSYLWFGLAGVVSGVIAGMGMGGGTLLIPILTIFLSVAQRQAQGINLIAFIPTAVVALIIHAKNKLVDWKTGLPLIVGGVVASIGGACLAMQLSNKILQRLFGGFLLLVGVWQVIYTIYSIRNNKQAPPKFKWVILTKYK